MNLGILPVDRHHMVGRQTGNEIQFGPAGAAKVTELPIRLSSWATTCPVGPAPIKRTSLPGFMARTSIP